jgi:hypothetical protein
MPNPDTAAHAARLRKMAEQMPSMGQRTIAALLAGAMPEAPDATPR